MIWLKSLTLEKKQLKFNEVDTTMMSDELNTFERFESKEINKRLSLNCDDFESNDKNNGHGDDDDDRTRRYKILSSDLVTGKDPESNRDANNDKKVPVHFFHSPLRIKQRDRDERAKDKKRKGDANCVSLDQLIYWNELLLCMAHLTRFEK